MTCRTRLVALIWLAFAIGTVSCDGDTPQGNAGGAGSNGSAGGSGGSSLPSRGPIADAGSGIVVVGGSGGAAGAPAGTGGVAGTSGAGSDGGPTVPICPDGVRGNDIACDANVDVICISDCMNNRRIRCGCTSRGQGGQRDDRWVCGGQPQDCQ